MSLPVQALPETPADAARVEAARQAVILVAGIAGALIIMSVQKQMLRGLLPGGDATERMTSALRRERWYGKAAVFLARADLWRAARWAELRSWRARMDYEQEKA